MAHTHMHGHVQVSMYVPTCAGLHSGYAQRAQVLMHVVRDHFWMPHCACSVPRRLGTIGLRRGCSKYPALFLSPSRAARIRGSLCTLLDPPNCHGTHWFSTMIAAPCSQPLTGSRVIFLPGTSPSMGCATPLFLSTTFCSFVGPSAENSTRQAGVLVCGMNGVNGLLPVTPTRQGAPGGGAHRVACAGPVCTVGAGVLWMRKLSASPCLGVK